MAESNSLFTELGISMYIAEFTAQGFDTWNAILNIRESDFDTLGVKLGHRRKLQRKIADIQGLSPSKALWELENVQSERHHPTPKSSQARESKSDARKGCRLHRLKRMYRRHPIPDLNAPKRPYSAYVLFANKVREDHKNKNLPFVEMAKLVGVSWRSLPLAELKPYREQAFSAKEEYLIELAHYKGTDSYKEYTQYMTMFLARKQNLPLGMLLRKTPRLLLI